MVKLLQCVAVALLSTQIAAQCPVLGLANGAGASGVDSCGVGTTTIADSASCTVVCQGGYTPSEATAYCPGTTLVVATCEVSSPPGCAVTAVANGAGTNGAEPCGPGITSIADGQTCTMACQAGFTASALTSACVTGNALVEVTCAALCASDVCTASSRTPVAAQPTCAANPCTVEECCYTPGTCTTGSAGVCTAARLDASSPPICASTTCTIDECCDAAPVCAANACDATSETAFPTQQVCATPSCTTAECCYTPGTCTTGSAGVCTAARLDASSPPICASTTCTIDECCDAAPVCATNACDATSETAFPTQQVCATPSCTTAECCYTIPVAPSSATCTATVCTASSRTPVSATPTCASDPCTVDECCQAASTPIEVTKVTSTITAALDFDPSASASAAKVAAFRAGVLTTLALPESVTASMVELTFVAVTTRRLDSHATSTSYTITVEISLPAGVNAATVEGAVTDITQTALSTNIMAAFVSAGLPEPTLTVSAMSAPVTATETVTDGGGAESTDGGGAESMAACTVACPGLPALLGDYAGGLLTTVDNICEKSADFNCVVAAEACSDMATQFSDVMMIIGMCTAESRLAQIQSMLIDATVCQETCGSDSLVTYGDYMRVSMDENMRMEPLGTRRLEGHAVGNLRNRAVMTRFLCPVEVTVRCIVNTTACQVAEGGGEGSDEDFSEPTASNSDTRRLDSHEGDEDPLLAILQYCDAVLAVTLTMGITVADPAAFVANPASEAAVAAGIAAAASVTAEAVEVTLTVASRRLDSHEEATSGTVNVVATIQAANEDAVAALETRVNDIEPTIMATHLNTALEAIGVDVSVSSLTAAAAPTAASVPIAGSGSGGIPSESNAFKTTMASSVLVALVAQFRSF